MLPDMSDVLREFEVSVTLLQVSQTVVNNRPVETETPVSIKAVVQPADKEKLNPDTIDWSLRYLQVHSSSAININDRLLDEGLKYKAVSQSDYSKYGYQETIFEQIK